MQWYEKAAEQDQVDALWALAKIFDTGRGVPNDPRQALALMNRAAQLGSLGAELQLADDYYAGHGLAEDKKQAATWYAKAADRPRNFIFGWA
ncbi:MAG: hypothetical protein P4K93_01180 [Terracidiphilus sp.]|nr:hypothetical protein [Terracidiphilus sp.]